MSKYVKNLIPTHRSSLRRPRRAAGEHGRTERQRHHRLRKELRAKNINVLVVKNSLAARADGGTPLAPDVRGHRRHGGHLLGRRGHRQPGQGDHPACQERRSSPRSPRGGVMDGEQLTADQVAQVSKWPSRDGAVEPLGGPDPRPGARLASQLIAVGGALASQIAAEGRRGEEEAGERQSRRRPSRAQPAAAEEPRRRSRPPVASGAGGTCEPPTRGMEMGDSPEHQRKRGYRQFGLTSDLAERSRPIG